MDLNEKSSSWNEGVLVDQRSTVDPTVDPGISVSIMEEVPSVTVATIIVVTVIVVIAIATVFLLGVLLDCRQQRLLEKKMGEAKKQRKQRRENTHQVSDIISIVNDMEEVGISVAPAEMLRHTP